MVKVDDCMDVEKLHETLPSYLIDLFRRSIENLMTIQISKQALLLTKFHELFAKDDYDLGFKVAIKHKIETGDAHPMRPPMRRTPLGMEAKDHLDYQVLYGFIEPCLSGLHHLFLSGKKKL